MFKHCFSAILLAATSMQVMAADDAEKVVREAFKKVSPTANITEVKRSEVPGFYQVLVDANVYFISGDGKYLIRGNVFDIDSRQDIGDKQLSAMRRVALAKIPKDKELVFAPPNPKYSVTVFTDVDCPYCRQFHKQIAAFNQAGIAVQYVFFPLQIHPGADKKAVSVWCAQDRAAAYTAAMNGQDLPAKTCDNPIAETTALGMKMGIGGTPTILTPDGTQVNGNAAADAIHLAAELDRLATGHVAATAK